jgi:hypothetical protein
MAVVVAAIQLAVLVVHQSVVLAEVEVVMEVPLVRIQVQVAVAVAVQVVSAMVAMVAQELFMSGLGLSYGTFCKS